MVAVVQWSPLSKLRRGRSGEHKSPRPTLFRMSFSSFPSRHNEVAKGLYRDAQHLRVRCKETWRVSGCSGFDILRHAGSFFIYWTEEAALLLIKEHCVVLTRLEIRPAGEMFGEECRYKDCEIVLFNDIILLLHGRTHKYRALAPPLYLKAIVVKQSEVCSFRLLARAVVRVCVYRANSTVCRTSSQYCPCIFCCLARAIQRHNLPLSALTGNSDGDSH